MTIHMTMAVRVSGGDLAMNMTIYPDGIALIAPARGKVTKMENKVWSKAKFQLAEECDVKGSFEGYHTGDDWNGWAMPYFPEAEADKLRQAIQDSETEYARWVEIESEVEGREGQMVKALETSQEKSDDTYWEPTEIVVDGKPITVWPIGAGGWVWQVVEKHNFLGYERRPGNRLFRYACECGAVGKWRVSKANADSDFSAHIQDADLHQRMADKE